LGNLPGKVKIFREFASKNRNFPEIKIDFFTRIHDLPHFKPDWRRCSQFWDQFLCRQST